MIKNLLTIGLLIVSCLACSHNALEEEYTNLEALLEFNI